MNIVHQLQEIDELTHAFKGAFGGLSGKQLNWKPGADIWSIAQNIHHLIVINGTYFPVVEQVRQGKYARSWVAQIPFLVNGFGNFILKSVHPDRKKRIKTFSIWQPSTSDLPSSILDTFEAHQQQLKQFIFSCEDLVSAGQVISSPANRTIVYKLEKAFEIMIQHERRHLNQALEVLKMKGFPP